MSESPAITGSGVVELTVLSDGTDIGELRIVSVEIVRRVNAIPLARLVLEDGDMPRQGFPLSDAGTLAPGVDVEIRAGYDGEKETLFRGVLVKHGVRVTRDGRSSLVIECRDPAVRMTLARRNAVHLALKDSEVATKLIGSHAGLSADVAATAETHAEMVQYHTSDWDYLLARAEVNGQVVTVDAGKVTLAAPDVSGSPALTVAFGEDLIAFDAELDARTQFGGIDAAAWDPETQTLAEVAAAKPAALNAQGNLTSEALAKVVGPDVSGLQSSVPIDKPRLKGWAEAAQLKAGLARIRGRMTFQGSAKALPGTLIEVKGVGERFEGEAWIGAVRHTIAEGDWTTEVELDDGRKQLMIETPAGNRVTLDEEDARVRVEDQHGNVMTFGESGIEMSSPKDIAIEANGKISLKAGGSVEVTAGGDIEASGTDIKHDAKAGFTAKGALSAELSASGQTTVKGAMVMIN